jgi:signal transduction histidine kinase
MLNIIDDIVSISKIESGQINLSYKKLQSKNQLQSLSDYFKLEANEKNTELKINNALSEDNLIRTDEEKFMPYYRTCLRTP